MFHGFYNLTSGIVCQNRTLDVISNNMVNVTTPGYKADKLTTSTFREEMRYRTGNIDKSNPTPMGTTTSMLRAAGGTVTDYTQGGFDETGGALDFALTQPGFFVIQTQDGGNVYTRDGSFSIDEEGYLALPGVGRVMGQGGPIQLNSDSIQMDLMGNITDPATGAVLGSPQVVDFENYDQLTKTEYGCYTTGEQGAQVNGGLMWKTLERSNVNSVEEMTSMMSSQRAIQSAVQMLKMYDQLTGKIVTEIGRT